MLHVSTKYKKERMNTNPEILYEDAHILCAVKPVGLAVQNASFGRPDMESILKNYLSPKAGGKIPELYVVHRLDQPVEGILVFAKTKKAAVRLQNQITEQRMQKQYLAVVEKEIPEGDRQQLTDWLKKDRQQAVVTAPGDKTAKKAVLEWKAVQTEAGSSLLQIHLKTGRFHQIRCQLAHVGMPIVGDVKYGGQPLTGGQGIALCAFSLTFTHPVTGKSMAFVHSPAGVAFTVFQDKIAELCGR